jgi:lauroyl/myristoyl acyltransferase
MSKKRSNVGFIENWFFTAIFYALGLIPSKCHIGLADLLEFVCRPLLGKEYRKIALNIEKVNGIQPQSEVSIQFQRQVMRHQFIAIFEVFRSIIAPQEIVFKGMDELKANLQSALAKNRGVVMITGHLGSLEHIGHAASQVINEPIVALAKPTKLELVTRFIDKIRSKFNIIHIWNDQKSILREMIGTLHKGKPLCFVMDQRPDNRKGHLVSFLGHPTEFVVGPTKIALRCNAPILSAYCTSIGSMTFQVSSRLLWDGEQKIDDERALTQKLADDIGGMIKLYPEQWFWNYNRWSFPKKGKQ